MRGVLIVMLTYLLLGVESPILHHLELNTTYMRRMLPEILLINLRKVLHPFLLRFPMVLQVQIVGQLAFQMEQM